MQATTPKTAKKPKIAASSATELTQKMETQLKKANEVLEKMVDTMSGDNPPPNIRDMQQQLIDMQNNMKDMERMHEDLQYDLQDLEALAANTHQTLFRQQQRDALLQTVVKPWPSEFYDEDRERVIRYYAEKAGVEGQYTPTHGRNVYGRYKPSTVTIMNWKTEKAKLEFESYVYRRYNKRFPATVWDHNNATVYHHSGQPHRITFSPQVSDMERDINQAINAALHIVTTNDKSDLAGTWGKIAVKWQEKLAMRTEDKLVIFKLVRNEEDPKLLHFHVHKDYYDVVYDNWRAGWAEANAKTKWPDYNKYPYIIKFARLRSNEEYRTMYNAKWGGEEHWDMQRHTDDAAEAKQSNGD
ncbi:unnamed protein product [Symbiodinium necroappetens]|uniref:Uncharacterized protein n=1 Tax=Symbiodinium necroappetens TaxID=1628268 RepID=A0A813BVH2_9DINO|nr:unnamed protein product [Symbiodinium necroappetens]